MLNGSVNFLNVKNIFIKVLTLVIIDLYGTQNKIAKFIVSEFVITVKIFKICKEFYGRPKKTYLHPGFRYIRVQTK